MSDSDPRTRRRDSALDLNPPIDADRACPQCGYNLKGLRIGGVCPECGRTISFKISSRRDLRLHDERTGIIRLVQIGMALSTLGASAAAAGLASQAISDRMSTATLMLASGMWVSGLTMLAFARWSRTEPTEQRADLHAWLVAGSAATQSLWLGVAALTTLGGSNDWIDLTNRLLAAAAMVGFIPTVFSLGRLAEWVGDELRSHRLNITATLLGVFGALIAVDWALRAPFPFPLFANIAAFALVFSLAYVLWSLAQLTTASLWSSRIAQFEQARIERLRRRVRDDIEQREQRRRDAEPFGGPVKPPPGSMMGVDTRPDTGPEG